MEKYYYKLLMTIVIFLFASNKGISQNFSNPSIEWQKCIGGSDDDYATSIIQTSDGGYITVGTATSNDFDLIENQGGATLFVVKLSNGGAIEWKKCIEGTGSVLLPKIIQNNRGGYTVSALKVSSIIDFNGLDRKSVV